MTSSYLTLSKINTDLLFEFKETTLIIDLYQYYFNNGFHNIIIEKISKLLISYLLIFIINLVINCIDYKELLTLDSKKTYQYLYDYIDMSKWFPSNPYLIICFMLYCIYLISNTINCISMIKKFRKIRIIYNKYLNINDYRLKFVTWDEIIGLIIQKMKPCDTLDTTNINIYTVNNKINQQSNIIIALLRSNLISLNKLSKFLEWNFIFCIIDPMLNIIKTPDNISQTNIQSKKTTDIDYILDDINTLNNKKIYKNYNTNETAILMNKPINLNTLDHLDHPDNNIHDTAINIHDTDKFNDILYNTFITHSEIPEYTEYINKVNFRINLAIFINLIAMPFTILILLVYMIIKYGEKMYINPSILFQKQLDIKVKWQLRYYNELPNLFKDRIFRIERNMDKIINSYHSPLGQIIYRFLIFTIGSIFLILLSLSFIANETFSELHIFKGHNIIWFLGGSGTLLIILNKCILTDDKKLTKNEQINAFEELREDLVSINPYILKTEDREYLVNIIQQIYQSRIMHIIYEIWHLFITPYYLWKWKKDIFKNYNQILELLDNHYVLGNVCKYSIFTNLEDMENNPHMLLSFKEFHNNHNWNIPNFINTDFNLKNSILLQSKIFN